MKTEGQADVTIDIVDISVLISTGLKGITGFFGVTERGPVGKPLIVGSWEAYQDNFGGLIPESDFPLYCKRALEAGGRLRVGRVGHYTAINSTATLVGTKATLVKNIPSAVTETRATSTLTVSVAGAQNDTFDVYILEGGLPKSLGSIVVGSGESTTIVAGKIVTVINAGTLAHGYTATSSSAVVTITAPVGSGAKANSYSYDNEKTGTVAATTSAFAGGVTAAQPVVLTFNAPSIGAWANGKLYAFSTPSPLLPNLWDLTVGIVGNDRVTRYIKGIPLNPTTNDIANYNAVLRDALEIVSITTMGTFSLSLFTGGVENKSAINLVDHIGDSTAKTGVQMFNDDTDITKIAAPALAIPEMDIALAAYADMRKDVIALVRTPIGVTSQGAIDYREGTGAYTHAPINSWRAFMFTGGLRITHPLTAAEYQIGELGDLAAVISKKDTSKAEWWSFSGPKRGRVSNALGVVQNFRSPARKLEGDNLSVHGINAVVQHETFGTVFWDNMTLYKSNTLLKYANVAELLVFLTRALKPVTESELFDPNDIETWKQVHRNVKPLMESIKAGRGIWEYLYQGDQDIDNISQAVVNSPSNIDAGAYKFRLFIQPKTSMKFIPIEVIVTNSGIDFNELISQGV